MTAKRSPELMLTVNNCHAVFKYISLSYLVLSLSNFHSNLVMGFPLINDNKNGCQNGQSLSFRICGNSNVLAKRLLTVHIWVTFIRRSPSSNTSLAR